MKDVDARAQGVLGLDRQVSLELLQGGERGGIDVDELQVHVGQEDVRGRVLQHRREARLLGLGPTAMANVLPVDDVPEDIVPRPIHAVNAGPERDVPERELGLVRQRGRVPKDALHAPLVLVEAVDRAADDIVDVDVEGVADLVLETAEGLHGTLVGVDDDELGVRE